jgi:4-hydroxy-3-methylbut-2-enyl diphosphate reductase
MEVIRAEAMGLCFGVRRALAYAATIRRPELVTIYGELVHNERVNRKLEALGFQRLAERERGGSIPGTEAVLITAHGVSDSERERLRAAGRVVLDATCPLVRRAHDAALRLEAEGRLVVVVGRRGHVEVQGLTGDLCRAVVVESPEEVRCYDAPKIGVICQTTSSDRLVQAVLRAIQANNPGKPIDFVDTVCGSTRERQQALERLLPVVDAVVIVGGKNSRNTRQLAEAARAGGVRAWRVESAAELDRAWFEGCRAVGLTAGTSALDETIDEVDRALHALPAYAPAPPLPILHRPQVAYR